MPSNSSKEILTQKIKAEALRLGFSACGIASAQEVEQAHYFREWIAQGNQAEMAYLTHHMEKRTDPRLLVEGTRSIVSVALNYYPRQTIPDKEYQIAWYAYGNDYHDIVCGKLTELLHRIQTEHPEVQGRAFCDTAPVLERYWAWKAGLGWIGKNTLLILPEGGSCFFLGELFLNTELVYDQPRKNRCGSCEKCLNACPGGALTPGRKLDARKCLSYLTIEHRGELPEEISLLMENRIYGCDECQKVCPWNRFASPCVLPELQPSPNLLNMKKNDWDSLTEEKYQDLFRKSAVKRAKFVGLMRNIRSLQRTSPSINTPPQEDRPLF
ncbi:MAG: tRNA epoxyqueuosine(34) reductase QueG [Bacteroides sp.]|nr:tRNA epoxyqueuosine(34) reductase QueG [Bacteroides sp.]